MESILITAQVKKGHHDAVRTIIAQGPPFELPIEGIDRHCVFVRPGSISFLFEGPPGLRRVVRSLVSKRPVMSQMMRIGTHLEGMPRELDTAFRWSRDDAVGSADEGVP